MKTMLRSMMFVVAAAGTAPAQSVPTKALEQIREAVKIGDFDMAEIGLRRLWGEAGTKSRFKKVSDQEWGGPTGRPPRIPPLERPRPTPPREERPRPAPPRETPPEIPKLPPSVIPGTTRPTQ